MITNVNVSDNTASVFPRFTTLQGQLGKGIKKNAFRLRSTSR